ncbi:MAG: T9SS type A sorting domain-containing protein [Polaribacter sp.]|nr:T9SS type A sorting domain-containing protein [Polaribacter sp.]
MADDALQYLLSNLLSNKNTIISKELLVFPNPVDNLLTFDNSKIKSLKVQVFSINGELLSTNNFSNFLSDQKIVFSKFSKGIYFLKIITEKGAITQKIIKK